MDSKFWNQFKEAIIQIILKESKSEHESTITYGP